MEKEPNKLPHIVTELENKLLLEDAEVHVNGNPKTEKVRRQDEYSRIIVRIIERMASRLVESNEKYSTINHVEPHHFKTALSVATEFSGIDANCEVRHPNTGLQETIIYKYLVGLELQKLVCARADQLARE
jgi:hypothetical protein